MKVLKFGGSSLADAEAFRLTANIIGTEPSAKIIVLSATAGTTDQLQQLTTTSTQTSLKILHHIFAKHSDLAVALGLNKHHQHQQAMADFKHQLTDIIVQNKEQDYPLIWAAGEYLSCFIMTDLLLSQGIKSQFVDSRNYLIAEREILDARANVKLSAQRWCRNPPPQDSINIMPGFISSHVNGSPCLLGRNGSDYSAALFANLVQASCCEIWTDVNGVYQADPRLLPQASPISRLSYEEIMELAHHGAKVIHPKSIVPLRLKAIPLRIKNTFEPESPGTLIEHEAQDELKIKGVTCQQSISLINISGSYLYNTHGAAARLFKCLADNNISIILISQSSSEYSICFAIHSNQLELAEHCLNVEFQYELKNKQLNPIKSLSNRAIVTLVGKGLKHKHGIAAKYFNALSIGNINIEAIAQGSSECSISVVIKNDQSELACKRVYDEFFDRKQSIDLFIIGCGNVGHELIKQIRSQQGVLANKKIDVNICLIANSTTHIYGVQANSADWQDALAQSHQRLSLELLKSYINSGQHVNPTIVDCTCSEAISKNYADYLQLGFNLVTANKKANSAKYDDFLQLHNIASNHFRKYLYETNVGAGLPVLKTLNSLQDSGDEISSIQGILSGSLSYILGELDKGKPFSEVVIKAMQLGYTEPDPRDDLGGIDVARKLLILARSTGKKLDMHDIHLTPLLPADFDSSGELSDFISRLVQLDDYFYDVNQKAHSDNQRLRYVAQMDGQNLKVGLKLVDQNDPLYHVHNGENAITILSRYYSPIPMFLKGYGAGSSVTAAGLFSDIMQTIPHREQELL